jgi:transposase
MRVMAAPRKYPEELRERAIRIAVDARRDPVTRPGALQRAGEQLGINPETLRGWVSQAQIDAGERVGTATSDTARLAEMHRAGQPGLRNAPSPWSVASRQRPAPGARMAAASLIKLVPGVGNVISAGVASTITGVIGESWHGVAERVFTGTMELDDADEMATLAKQFLSGLKAPGREPADER